MVEVHFGEELLVDCGVATDVVDYRADSDGDCVTSCEAVSVKPGGNKGKVWMILTEPNKTQCKDR